MERKTAPRKRDIKGGLILSVVAVLLLLIGVQESRLMVCGKTADAVIVSRERSTSTSRRNSGDRSHTYKVRYAFRHDGKRYEGSFTKKAYDIMDIASGKSVQVRFIPGNPSTNSAVEQLNPLFVLLKLAGGVALMVFSFTRFRGTEGT